MDANPTGRAASGRKEMELPERRLPPGAVGERRTQRVTSTCWRCPATGRAEQPFSAASYATGAYFGFARRIDAAISAPVAPAVEPTIATRR